MTSDPTGWPAEGRIGGHPALDFLNTAGGRTRARDAERLDRFTDAIGFAEAAGAISPAEAAALAALADADPAAAGTTLAALRDQREALHHFLRAGIEGAAPSPDVCNRVEADLKAAYGAAHLAAEGWTVAPDACGLHLIARRLALATASLLTSADRGHVRMCQACSWMFLDPSPTQRRRWCSMATCGNRAKARRHYAKGS